MKRFYATIALCAAVVTGAFAQRNIKLNVAIIAPTTDANIVTGSTTSPSYAIQNQGPDSLKQGDTLFFQTPINTTTEVSYIILPIKVDSGMVIPLNNTTISGFDVPFANIKTLLDPTTVATVSAPFTNNTKYAWFFLVDVGAPAANGDVTLTGTLIDTTHIWINKANAINEIAKVEAVSCYPNPATGLVSFDFNYTVAAAATVRVMDAAGRTVLTKELEKNGIGNQKIDVDVTSLSNGNYFLEFNCNDRKATSRFTIQK